MKEIKITDLDGQVHSIDLDHIGNQALHIDCMELMKALPDKAFELAIVDPPYGINIETSGTYFKQFKTKGWDCERPSAEYFAELQRISKNQIIWGGNYFADLLPPKKGWIFWDKKITNANNTNFSDGELAWTSFKCILKRFTYDWIGFGYINNPQHEKKIRPTQKPVELYAWLLFNYAHKGDKILDTHLGSQSSRIAAWQAGYDFLGCEIDKDYYEQGCQRYESYAAQYKLF